MPAGFGAADEATSLTKATHEFRTRAPIDEQSASSIWVFSALEPLVEAQRRHATHTVVLYSKHHCRWTAR